LPGEAWHPEKKKETGDRVKGEREVAKKKVS